MKEMTIATATTTASVRRRGCPNGHHPNLKKAFKLIQRAQEGDSYLSSDDDEGEEEEDNIANEQLEQSLLDAYYPTILHILHLLLKASTIILSIIVTLVLFSRICLTVNISRFTHTAHALFEPQIINLDIQNNNNNNNQGSLARPSIHMFCISPLATFRNQEPIKLPIPIGNEFDSKNAVTYILEAGPGQSFMDFVNIQDEMKRMFKETDQVFICSFDRIGNGLSSGSSHDIKSRNVTDYSQDLIEALQIANLPNQYVYASHSLSSHFALHFSTVNIHHMRGILLLDPWLFATDSLHEHVLQKTKTIMEYLSNYWTKYGLIRWLTLFGRHPWNIYFQQLPDRFRNLAVQYYHTSAPYESFVRETEMIQKYQATTKNSSAITVDPSISTLGDLPPVIVVSSLIEGPNLQVYFNSSHDGEMFSRETIYNHLQIVSGDTEKHVILSHVSHPHFVHTSFKGAQKIAQLLVSMFKLEQI